jgi:large repetitive protein
MVIVFMVSRSFRSATLALIVAAAALSASCQKVPLLAPAGSTITLTAAASALPINGSTDLIAQLIESGGVPPHSGTRVTFTTNIGRIEPSEADTDVGGRATVKFIATTSGVASITALSGGTSITAANAVKIQIGAAAVGNVSLGANPTTLPSAGGTTDLTATVNDTSGNPLPGVPVSFSIDTSTTTSSGAGSFAASVVTTDASGRATTQFTTNRTTTVVASAGVATTGGGTGGTGTSSTVQTAKATINVNSTATITVGTVVPATPSVNQAVTVPLTYGTTGSPISRVTVNWGDGTTSSVPGQPAAVSHTYSQPGTFSVQITGTDAFGDPANTATSITVTSSRPTVTVTPPSTGVHPGAAATFTIAAAVPTGSTASIASVTINWGDGTAPITVPGNVTSASHIYGATGSFPVTVTATDTNGQQGTASTIINVT